MFVFSPLFSPATAQGVDLVSQVDELTVAALARLPTNPHGRVDGSFCPPVILAPDSKAGQSVAGHGWGVTGEIALNGLSFVSFVGRVSQGTSGSCFMADGNIAIFRGDVLESLIYAQPHARRGIGEIVLGEGGIRVWDGDYLQRPLADLRLYGADLVIVTGVAQRDPFCAGSISVPNLYGIPVHLARRLLLDEGWAPVPLAQLDDSISALTVRRMQQTLPEVQSCSGTGYGYCNFAYQSAGGASLSVTTAGEAEAPSSPSVVGYSVICPP